MTAAIICVVGVLAFAAAVEAVVQTWLDLGRTLKRLAGDEQ